MEKSITRLIIDPNRLRIGLLKDCGSTEDFKTQNNRSFIQLVYIVGNTKRINLSFGLQTFYSLITQLKGNDVYQLIKGAIFPNKKVVTSIL